MVRKMVVKKRQHGCDNWIRSKYSISLWWKIAEENSLLSFSGFKIAGFLTTFVDWFGMLVAIGFLARVILYNENENIAEERQNKGKQKTYGTEMVIEKALFKIVGMYCTSCKPIVEKQLKDEQSIKKIEIDYMTDSIIVEFDSASISKEEIKDRLEKSGYKFVRLAR